MFVTALWEIGRSLPSHGVGVLISIYQRRQTPREKKRKPTDETKKRREEGERKKEEHLKRRARPQIAEALYAGGKLTCNVMNSFMDLRLMNCRIWTLPIPNQNNVRIQIQVVPRSFI